MNEGDRPKICSDRNPIRKNPGTIGLMCPKLAKVKIAAFEGIEPNVPRFIRIGIRFERVLGRSTEFAQKLLKIKNATFEGIEPNVPRFFRIGFRFERILGRSA